MFTPDYDDYYSLVSYASRFVSDPEDVVRAYFERISSINRLILWEKDHGNTAFKESLLQEAAEHVLENGTPDCDMLEILKLSNAFGVLVDGSDKSADISIYNDFVAYLTENGINA